MPPAVTFPAIARISFLALLLVAGLLTAGSPLTSQSSAQAIDPSHPLDALTYHEIETVVGVLRKKGLVSDETTYPVMTLVPMPKSEVLDWRPGKPFSRAALVVARRPGETREAVVDITRQALRSSRLVEDGQPAYTEPEWRRATRAVAGDDRFRSALRGRGIKDPARLLCAAEPPGYFPSEPYEQSRRIMRVRCQDPATARHRFHPTPVEGLSAIVDADTGTVIDVIDRTPQVSAAIDAVEIDEPAAMAPLNPVVIATPEGPNFTLSGALGVNWLNWSFHLRADRRSGLVVSLVRFNDRGEDRLIVYEMELGEIFVPYMDPGEGWATRTFLDAAEFGLGYLASPLDVGTDCPASAYYITLFYPSDYGGQFAVERALCIFEQPTGAPAWRHYDLSSDTVEARRGVELVVRMIPTIGNYDYIVDYVFAPTGSIRMRVGATGVDAVKAVEADDLGSPTAERDTRFGALVAPNLVAPYHDHYFSYRIDMAVDGPDNTFIREVIEPARIDGDNPRTSLWRLKRHVMETEGPLDAGHHGRSGEIWRVINPNRRTAPLGYHPGFELMPGHGLQTSVLSPDDPAQQRAAFSAWSLAVTRRNAEERYSTGAYPVRHPGRGLPEYMADRESIVNTDIVLWYTIGFRHVTRPEDWPVLPTMWHDFTLRPYGFFARDPSSTLPPPQ